MPNLAFLMGAIYLARWSRLASPPVPQPAKGPVPQLARVQLDVVTMVAGSALVLVGGTSKAIWKLLVTLGVGDFWLLGELQFMLLAPGCLAMLVSVVLALRAERHRRDAAWLAMAPWKIPLLATMTLSSLSLQGLLSYLAFRRKARLAGAMYVVSILCMLSMAGLAGGEQSIARQWIEESINAAGQIAFALGSYWLYVRFAADLNAARVAHG